MTEILALLQTIAPLLEKTIFRQMSQVIFGMLVASGRITMLGLSRWTEKGGSYRTVQRFYHSAVSWKIIQFYGQFQLCAIATFPTTKSRLQYLGFEITLSWLSICQRDNKNASAHRPDALSGKT
jgi:hypothetical protein